MKAITVQPHTLGSSSFDDVPEPDPRDGSVLVEAIAVAVCGTDVENKAGQALAHADATWLARLLSRRERPEAFMNARHRRSDDIKVVIQFADA